MQITRLGSQPVDQLDVSPHSLPDHVHSPTLDFLSSNPRSGMLHPSFLSGFSLNSLESLLLSPTRPRLCTPGESFSYLSIWYATSLYPVCMFTKQLRIPPTILTRPRLCAPGENFAYLVYNFPLPCLHIH